MFPFLSVVCFPCSICEFFPSISFPPCLLGITFSTIVLSFVELESIIIPHLGQIMAFGISENPHEGHLFVSIFVFV